MKKNYMTMLQLMEYKRKGKDEQLVFNCNIILGKKFWLHTYNYVVTIYKKCIGIVNLLICLARDKLENYIFYGK